MKLVFNQNQNFEWYLAIFSFRLSIFSCFERSTSA